MKSEDLLLRHLQKTAQGRTARAEGVTAADVDPEQLKKGMKVEAEHTTDKATAKEITLDHLAEFKGKPYYTELPKMEKKLEKAAADLPGGEEYKALLSDLTSHQAGRAQALVETDPKQKGKAGFAVNHPIWSRVLGILGGAGAGGLVGAGLAHTANADVGLGLGATAIGAGVGAGTGLLLANLAVLHRVRAIKEQYKGDPRLVEEAAKAEAGRSALWTALRGTITGPVDLDKASQLRALLDKGKVHSGYVAGGAGSATNLLAAAGPIGMAAAPVLRYMGHPMEAAYGRKSLQDALAKHAFVEGYQTKTAGTADEVAAKLPPGAPAGTSILGAGIADKGKSLLRAYLGMLRKRNGSLTENIRATAVLPEYDERKPHNLLSMAPRNFGAAEGVAALRAKVRPQEALAVK